MAGRRCRGRGAALPRGGRGRGWAGGGVAGPVPSHRGAKFKPRAPAERDAAEGPGRTGPGSPGAAVGSAPAGLHGECTGTAAPLPLPRTGAAELRGGRPAVSSPPPPPFPARPFPPREGTGPEPPAPPGWGGLRRGGTRSSRDGAGDPSGRGWFAWDGAWTDRERGRSGRERDSDWSGWGRSGREKAWTSRNGAGEGSGWGLDPAGRVAVGYGAGSRWGRGSGPAGRAGPEGPGCCGRDGALEQARMGLGPGWSRGGEWRVCPCPGLRQVLGLWVVELWVVAGSPWVGGCHGQGPSGWKDLGNPSGAPGQAAGIAPRCRGGWG